VPAALKSLGSRVTRGKRIAVHKGFMEGGRRELGNSGLKRVPAILVLARATSALLDGSIGALSVYRQEAVHYADMVVVFLIFRAIKTSAGQFASVNLAAALRVRL